MLFCPQRILISALCAILIGSSARSAAQLPPSTTTTQTNEVRYRIALVADPHCSPDPRYGEYVKNFGRVIQEVNDAHVDAVLIAGDVTQHSRPECFKLFTEMSKQFKAPMRCVPGNHDIGDKPLPEKAGTATKSRIGMYEKLVGPISYSEDVLPGVRVIGVASSIFETTLPQEAQQWEMLERELNDSRDGFTLVLTHYPPFNTSVDEKDGYFNISSAPRLRLLALLKRAKVSAVLSGHLHRPVTLEWDGIPIIGAPAVSFGLPEGKQQVGWRLISIHTDGKITSELRYLEGASTTQPSTEPSTKPARGELLRPTSKPSGVDVTERAQIFYYDWYGAPPLEPKFVHWVQGKHVPPDDIGSNFYPLLGAYSSSDKHVLKQHMEWIRQAHIGVLSLSWWGQKSYEEKHTLAVMDAAAEAGLKVNFHLEPYDGMTADRLPGDVAYLLEHYGKHPAFYRSQFDGKPIFYLFETLRHPANEWREALDRLRAHGEPVLLIAQTSDLDFITSAGFDGGYPYDVLTPFKDSSFLRDWNSNLARRFAAAGKLFIPSVGPGYWDDRAVPTNGADEPLAARTRDGGKATTYDAAWRAALEIGAPIITITSFNEWHEGSQIEPAVARKSADYEYPGYADGELQYIHRTAEWVDKLMHQNEAAPSPTTRSAPR